MASNSSLRSLLNIVIGRSAVRDPKQIAEELKGSAERLQKGNALYGKPSVSSEQKLKAEKNVKQTTQTFVMNLSRLLGLDQMQTLGLLKNFLTDEFRGSQSQLQSVFKNDKEARALMISVMEYYFDERIRVYHCLKHLFEYWQDARHPCREEYVDFVNELIPDRKLISELIDQYKELCEMPAPTWETHSELMTAGVSAQCAFQNLKEQVELLEVVLLYYRDMQMDARQLVDNAKLFQAQGFGTRQVNKYFLDSNADDLIHRIGFLQTLILIEGIDLDWLLNNLEPEDAEGHHIMQEVEQKEAIDLMLLNWDDSPFHSPIFLSWAVFTSLSGGASGIQHARKIGSRALQGNVFKVLSILVRSDCFSNDSAVSLAAKSAVHSLLATVLSVFDENSLGNSLPDIVSILCETLKIRHLCNEFWSQDGFLSLLNSLRQRFPCVFFLVNLFTVLSSHEHGPERVLEYLKGLDVFCEPFSADNLTGIQETDMDGVWKVESPRVVYRTTSDLLPSLVIPDGTLGRLFPERERLLIKWEFPFSGWHLFILEFDSLLYTVSLGTEIDSLFLVIRVSWIIRLVKQMLDIEPRLSESLGPLLERIYKVIQKFGASPNPPQDLIKSCIECVTTLAQSDPKLTCACLQQTGFLPHALATSKGNRLNVAPGNFGHMLGVKERPTGTFPVTLATLEMIGVLIYQLASSEDPDLPGDLTASAIFVVHEVFATFHKWRYTNIKEREQIGQKALKIFEYSLSDQKPIASLRGLVTQALLYSEAGQALLNMLAIGVDALDYLISHPNRGDVDGLAMVCVLKGALQVVMKLLNSTGQELSVIEEALSDQMVDKPTALGSQLLGDKVHIVSIIASYIHHRHDRELPVLSTQLLRRLCQASPMSLFGCLGPDNAAESIRDAYVLRLSARTEDVDLKVAILDFLSVAVETQPGLTELFLELSQLRFKTRTKEVNAKEKPLQFEIGRNSCLNPVLMAISDQRKGTVPLELLSASLQFLASLWRNRKDAPLSTIRNKEQLWAYIMRPLMGGFPDEVTEFHCSIASNALQIVAMECFYVTKGEMDPLLRRLLEQFSSQGKYKIWTNVLKEDAIAFDISDKVRVRLLKVWRTFLLVASNTDSDIFHLSADTKTSVLKNILEATHSYVLSGRAVTASAELASLYSRLLGRWEDSVSPPLSVLGELAVILQKARAKSTELLAAVEPFLLSASIVILLRQRKSQSERQALNSVDFHFAAKVLQIASLSVQQLALAKEDSHLKAMVVHLLVMGEVIQVLPDSDLWLQILEENASLSFLILVLDACLKVNKGVDFVDALMHFFLIISLYPKAAYKLAFLGIHHPLCLSLNFQETLGSETAANSSLKASVRDADSRKPSWTRVWHLSLSLMSSLLKRLGRDFVESALDFVGAHKEKLIKSLDTVRSNQNLLSLEEADHTAAFLANLAPFRRKWQFTMPHVFSSIKEHVGFLCHASCSLVARPQLLSRLVDFASEPLVVKSSHDLDLSPPRSRSGVKHVRFSSDFPRVGNRKRLASSSSGELPVLNPLFVRIQKRLLTILAHCLIFIRKMGPSLLHLMQDTAFDLADYPPHLSLSFNSPATERVEQPSFGTLVAAISACIVLLPKPPRVQTPTRSPVSSTEPTQDKSLVMLVIENSMWILLTEAVLYMRSPGIEFKKDRLGSELNDFLKHLAKQFPKRGAPGTPSKKSPSHDKSSLASSFADDGEQGVFRLAEIFVNRILK